MCKHVLNSTVYLQAPCCGQWFECTECHDEAVDHKMTYKPKIRFTCKQCKKCFVRDFKLFSEKDKKCGHCNTVWCQPAVTPESRLKEECLAIADGFFEKSVDPKQGFYTL